jgi:threonine synthase
MKAKVSSFQVCIEKDCSKRFDIQDRLYSCPNCGGLLDIVTEAADTPQSLRELWHSRLQSFDPVDRSGVWRYRELLPYTPDTKVITLSEGNTPLYDAPRCALYTGLDQLRLKHQGCNPTGSFKDTGMTTAVTQAVRLGARTVVCASTGNTSASLAAYAARAGLQCAILVPHGQISLGKLSQSLDYGAVVLEIEGNFDDAMHTIRELARDESIYLVNSINPFRIEGQKTVAAELLHQLNWEVPDHVVVPGGNLGNSAALGKGFSELFELGVIKSLPKLSVIQAEGAAPLASLYAGLVEKSEFANIGRDELRAVADPATLATAIKIGSPVSWRKSLRSVLGSGGQVLMVSEQEIADAKAVIGRDGIGCEPASATTVAGIKYLVSSGFIDPSERVVAVLTGHLLKDADYTVKYHQNNLTFKTATTGQVSIKSTYGNPPSKIPADSRRILDYLRELESKRERSNGRLD